MISKSADQWHVMGIIWSCLAVAAAAVVVVGFKALPHIFGGMLR